MEETNEDRIVEEDIVTLDNTIDEGEFLFVFLHIFSCKNFIISYGERQ